MNFKPEFTKHLEGVLKVEKINSVTPLAGNKYSINNNYIIESSCGSKFVLRMYPSDRACLQSDPSKYEYETLKTLESSPFSKYCPKVFHFDSSKKNHDDEFLLIEFLEGRPGGLQNLKDKKSVAEVGKLCSLLHSSFPDRTTEPLHEREYELYLTKDFIEEGFFRQSLKIDEKLKGVGLSNFSKQAKEAYEKSLEVTKPFLNEFKGVGRKKRIHGDFHIANMLFHEDSIKLLDWETSRYGHGHEDLAKMIVSGVMQKEMEEVLLRGYLSENEKVDEKLLWLFKIRTMAHMISFFIHNVAKDVTNAPIILVMGTKIYFENFSKLLDQKF